jgi:hypothetical protein
VLIEKEGVGRAAFYAPVAVDGEPGSVRRVRFVDAADGRLIGAAA